VESPLKIGFSYFSSPEYLLQHEMDAWLPSLRNWGCSFVTISANFDVAVPEDFFILAQSNGLEPVVHFMTSLPAAKVFNDTAYTLELYKKWGVNYVILGNQPNVKLGWPIAGWHFDALVDTFLDRFIPLALHAVRIGLNPIFPPLMPGGDYWDLAFLEMTLSRLKLRKMDDLLDNLFLSSSGYTFNRPLSWGEGGPERWPGLKPYQTLEGQEDQMGFRNYEWAQGISQRVTGQSMPVIILDAGRPDPNTNFQHEDNAVHTIKNIIQGCQLQDLKVKDQSNDLPHFNNQVLACIFSLDTLKTILGDQFSIDGVDGIFTNRQIEKRNAKLQTEYPKKTFHHYLLLPAYASGVSDVVLNKVRPLIKKLQPTVGFSIEEASQAARVTIFPDPFLFKDEQINQLRAAGCKVDILPDSGIDIATVLQ
jgi:hypothetical protein